MTPTPYINQQKARQVWLTQAEQVASVSVCACHSEGGSKHIDALRSITSGAMNHVIRGQRTL